MKKKKKPMLAESLGQVAIELSKTQACGSGPHQPKDRRGREHGVYNREWGMNLQAINP